MSDLPLLGYTRYFCKICGEECINHWKQSRTRYRECHSCHSLPVLDRGEPVDKILPDLRWAAHATILDLPLGKPGRPAEPGSQEPGGGPGRFGGALGRPSGTTNDDEAPVASERSLAAHSEVDDREQ